MRFSTFLVTVILLLIAATARAQMVNPNAFEFTSVDHSVVTRYEVGYFLVGATAPVQTVSLPKAEFEVVPGTPIYYRHALPRPVFGNFILKAQAYAPAAPTGEIGSGWSADASAPFSLSPLAPAGPRTVQ